MSWFGQHLDEDCYSFHHRRGTICHYALAADKSAQVQTYQPTQEASLHFQALCLTPERSVQYQWHYRENRALFFLKYMVRQKPHGHLGLIFLKVGHVPEPD